jgi:hypothetical protein
MDNSENDRDMTEMIDDREDNFLDDDHRDDLVESELICLNDTCDDAADDTGSDSGISDPSPDVLSRDGTKSPEDEGDEVDNYVQVIPHVVVIQKNENEKQTSGEEMQQGGQYRAFRPQKSRFQNPEKDILISYLSQDNIAVVNVDHEMPTKGSVTPTKRNQTPTNGTLTPTKTSSTTNAGSQSPALSGRVKLLEETYHPMTNTEYIPPRSTASHDHREDIHPGCFLLMSVLDFMMCL